MTCTKCQSDNAQSLRFIYEAGIQNINMSSNTYGGGFGGFGMGAGSARTTTTGMQQSALARKASPPPKKGYALFIMLIGFGILSAFLRFSVFVLLFTVKIGGLFSYMAWRYNKTQYPPKYEI